jgi:hypothetical protein
MSLITNALCKENIWEQDVPTTPGSSYQFGCSIWLSESELDFGAHILFGRGVQSFYENEEIEPGGCPSIVSLSVQRPPDMSIRGVFTPYNRTTIATSDFTSFSLSWSDLGPLVAFDGG